MKDFEDQTIVARFSPDEHSPIHDLAISIPIKDDIYNEAPVEYFAVRLDKSRRSHSPAEIGKHQVSLCQIVDNDRK